MSLILLLISTQFSHCHLFKFPLWITASDSYNTDPGCLSSSAFMTDKSGERSESRSGFRYSKVLWCDVDEAAHEQWETDGRTAERERDARFIPVRCCFWGVAGVDREMGDDHSADRHLQMGLEKLWFTGRLWWHSCHCHSSVFRISLTCALTPKAPALEPKYCWGWMNEWMKGVMNEWIKL